jgi:hypothetical protein
MTVVSGVLSFTKMIFLLLRHTQGPKSTLCAALVRRNHVVCRNLTTCLKA